MFMSALPDGGTGVAEPGAGAGVLHGPLDHPHPVAEVQRREACGQPRDQIRPGAPGRCGGRQRPARVGHAPARPGPGARAG